MNKYAKLAVQSTTTELAQQKRRSRGSSYFLQSLEPSFPPINQKFPPKVSRSKSNKRCSIRRSVADSERELSAQKVKQEESGENEEKEEKSES